MLDSTPRVVIVGGGFGGLAAATALRKTAAQVTLIDRQNHHLFQPLLYQVATSVLSPAQIASPIRSILRRQRNTTVILGEVTGVDSDRRRVFVHSVDREGVALEYDYLILATGASHSYFGHDEFAPFAPGLKSLADAVSIRNQTLSAFAAARPPKPPPTITTRGLESSMMALHGDSFGRKVDEQSEHREQKGQNHPVGECQDHGQRQALEHREGQVRNHRPAGPRHLGRPREDHGPPEEQRAQEEAGVLGVVPAIGVECQIVERRRVPYPEGEGECDPACARMEQPAGQPAARRSVRRC